jgi:LuxR family maltose regulon positive regulatory protein
MLADGSFAAAQEPAWSPWRDTALCMQAEALLLTGDVVQAAAVFAEAATLAAAMSNTDSLVDSEAELAVLALDRGCWAEAAEHLERALGAIDEYRMHDYPTSVLAFAGTARLAVHRGDLNEAERQLTQAMRARPSLTFALPYLAVRVRVQLAKVHWALGDLMTARHLLQEIDDVLHHRPALGTLLDEVAELRRSISATGQADAIGPSPLTAAELRLLPYLQTHHTIRDIAARLFVSRNTVNSQVSSIYRKLGVSSRDEAVQRATATGLLGG